MIEPTQAMIEEAQRAGNAAYAEADQIVFHCDRKVNELCQRIMNELRDNSETITELSKALNVFGYDVMVAVGVLHDTGHVIRCHAGKFERVQS